MSALPPTFLSDLDPLAAASTLEARQASWDHAQKLLRKLRLVFDARALNTRLLTSNPFAIPIYDHIFDKLSNFGVASILDMEASYHQLEVNPEHRDKLSFDFDNTTYRWRGAPFGLTHLTSHFQQLMTDILKDHLKYVVIYVDDVVIFSQDVAEHIQHVSAVIKTLTQFNVKLNTGKCHFGYEKLRILGHLVGKHGFRCADPVKTQELFHYDRPQTGKELMHFLGVIGFLGDYVPLMSNLLGPLNALRYVAVITDELWTPSCQLAFATVQKVLTQSPVLTAYNSKYPLHLAVDASQYGIGYILYQIIDDKVVYIKFGSRALNKGQRNYGATKRELLAIIFALNSCRPWIFGIHFTLCKNHWVT